MIMAISLLLFILLIRVFIYLHISKLNDSYFNGDTVGFATFLLIKYIPFLLTVTVYEKQTDALYLFIQVLFLGVVSSYVGYLIGRKVKIAGLRLPVQKKSAANYGVYLAFSLVAMVVAFYILAARGVGLYMWIFHNRESYLSGRAGNGIWYILFELFMIVSAILILCIADLHKNKKVLYSYIVIMIASYFSGSKGMMLSLAILFLVNYDIFFKRIRFGKLLVFGVFGLLTVVLLLRHQSGMSLLQYSDYYKQFIRFLDYVLHSDWKYMTGQLSWEEFIWKLIPRQIYPNKPFVYGAIRLVNIFFDTESIQAGNTPSLSEFVVPFADFGLTGVVLSFARTGLVQGFFEKNLRDNLKRNGSNFNAMFLYTLIFFARPTNFSNVYMVMFMCFFYAIQSIRLRFSLSVTALKYSSSR